MNIILAQISALLANVSLVLSNSQKTRKKILLFLIFNNIFDFIQYFLLNAYTGAFTSIICLFRTYLFNKKNNSFFFKKYIALYLIITIHIIVTIFTYNGLESIFPLLASVFYAIVLYQDKTKNIRIGSCIMSSMWITYNSIVGAYVSVITESIALISCLIAIYRFDIKKKKQVIDDNTKVTEEEKQESYEYI